MQKGNNMEKYPKEHALDGVYFRVARNNSWENICFSDLTDAEKQEVMCGRSETWLMDLCKILANKLYEIGEMFDIFANLED